MASSLQVLFLLSLTSGLFIAGAMSQEAETQIVQACPPGWTQFNTRCFIFFRRWKPWSEAESTCIGIGGNLASVHSSEENLFLANWIDQLVAHAGLLTWIGLTDAVRENKWLWSDGSQYNYRRWGPGEPNNYGIEHCTEMNWAGTFWNDRRCTDNRPFVCSRDAQIQPQ